MIVQPSSQPSNWKDSKIVGVVELTAISVFIFIQNKYKILPISEVPYLFLFGWMMLRLRGLKWRSIGLTKPEKWGRIIASAFVVGILIQVSSEFITEPLIAHFTKQPVDLSDFKDLPGNMTLALIYLVLIWTLAAFGEEFVFRGYILNRMADVGGRTTISWAIGLVLVSVLFGIGHFYQGISGMVGSGISSLEFGAIYFLFRRNLWAAVLAHGFSDTIGLALIYFGWAKV